MTTPAATRFDGSWFGDETPRDLARWALAGALVAMVHAALLGSYLFWRTPDEVIGDTNDNVSIELDPQDNKLMELHARLMQGDQPLTETWIFTERNPNSLQAFSLRGTISYTDIASPAGK